MDFATAATSFAQQSARYILFRYANILILYRKIVQILCISAHRFYFRTRPFGSWARTRENVNAAFRSEGATGMDFDLPGEDGEWIQQ